MKSCKNETHANIRKSQIIKKQDKSGKKGKIYLTRYKKYKKKVNVKKAQYT